MEITKAIEIISDMRECLASHVTADKESLEALSMAEDALRSNSIGYWIVAIDSDNMNYYYECSICRNRPLRDYYGKVKLSKRCPHCGARMVEPQESENI